MKKCSLTMTCPLGQTDTAMEHFDLGHDRMASDT